MLPADPSPDNVTSREEPANSGRHAFLSQEFKRSYHWLSNGLQRIVGSPADAEDVASATFVELAAFERLDTILQPRAMLRTIARRLTFDMWRRRDLEKNYLKMLALEPERHYPSPETVMNVVETLTEIDRRLDGLSHNARSAFLLRQLDGLAYEDIAERLGVSVSMVKKYMAQALAVAYLADE
jgi:RNA polymerase sigma-70 factor (ECF subfamily)